jgi:F0F1-type ATP synthase assembly protein I
MPQADKQPDQVEAARASLQLAFSVMGQIGLLTLGLVVGVLVLGVWLDRVLATKPLFTLLLFLASFPASMYIIYRVAMRAVARMGPPSTSLPRVEKEEVKSDDKSAA